MSDRIALVTGASRGIGLAAAVALAERGLSVVGCGRDEAATGRALASAGSSGRLHARGCDVAEEAQVEALFGWIDATFGRIDVLINNAGILHTSPIDELRTADWDRTMAVNLRGPFLCARAAFLRMKRQGGGSIVNISSLSGIRSVDKFPGYAAYTASKAGLVGLTEVLASEGRSHHIRVNAICPGAVDTDMLRQGNAGLRAGITPEQLARTIVFLATEDSDPLTGSTLEVFSNT